MSQLDDRDRIIGGKLPVWMADTYIRREGELQRQFPELGDYIRPIEVLCQALPSEDDLEVTVRKLRQAGLHSVQDVVKLAARQIGERCGLNTDELRALVAGLYAEWQNRRQQSLRIMQTPTVTSKMMSSMACGACESFGFVTVWVIDGERMEEFLVRRLYGTDFMFELAGQDNVEVLRVRCEQCK